MAGQKYQAIRESLVTLFRHTDLVPAAEINVLRDADPGSQRALALMFVELLYGEGELGARLGHFVTAFEKTLGKPAGWQLATTLPALLDPTGAVVVRPTIFRALAKWMAPGTSLPKSPTAVGYRRCLAMAQHLQTRLGKQGEKPRDLLDVYDFIRVTVRQSPKQAASK